MFEVKFHDINDVEDSLLKYSVIVSKYIDKWIWVKNSKRKTWEIPGGRREENEKIFETAKRELFEETGAIEYNLIPICVYSVKREIEDESYGMLFFAEIYKLDILPQSEIENIEFFQIIPDDLSFPQIQPKLFEQVKMVLKIL